jgi:lipoyl(octanoyl) transferase
VTQADLTASINNHSDQVVKAAPRHPLRSGALREFVEPVPYADAWHFQKRLHEERVGERRPDTLLLLEHFPVYTVGRTTLASHWGDGEKNLQLTGTQIHPVNRGGSITYHGPGQLVGYPILRLAHHASGPRQYVRLLEGVIIDTLGSWGIKGYRVDKKPGVWIRLDEQDAKIAAIGVRIERGVTLHGFALNVDMDLSPFSRIVPCGLTDCHVTSMAEALGSSVSLPAVRSVLQRAFSHAFKLEWTSMMSGLPIETERTR